MKRTFLLNVQSRYFVSGAVNEGFSGCYFNAIHNFSVRDKCLSLSMRLFIFNGII